GQDASRAAHQALVHRINKPLKNLTGPSRMWGPRIEGHGCLHTLPCGRRTAVTPALKPLDIVSWHNPSAGRDCTKLAMVVRVEDDRVWLTDGYTESGYILGDYLFGELCPLPEAEANIQQNRLMTLWQTHVWKRRV